MSILDDIYKAMEQIAASGYEPDAIEVTREGGEYLQAKYGGELVELPSRPHARTVDGGLGDELCPYVNKSQ